MADSTSATSFPQTHSEIEMENQRYSPATTMDASRASSSTAADPINSSNGDYSHDVFINHRGPDTKKNFASYLYRRLLVHGFRPFLDQHELQEGVHFPSQIIGAMRSASVHVAIFSPTYAASQWCLDELLLMQESRAPIIPVFYKVEPADLRWTDQNKTGVYAKALDKLQMKKTVDSQTHEEKPRYDSATIQNWRNALSSVADISGYDLDGKFNGDEGRMLNEIVERVVKMIKKPGLYVAKHPTGLNDKVTDFETKVLKQQQHTGKVQVAGIVGLGGVGKTTLALEFFNRESSKYKKSYFLADVRENAKKRSLHSLQRELLRGLTQLDLHVDNIYEGIGLFERHLKSSHVLLILDDIDHEHQLEALLPVKDVLRLDSLILITSRYKDVLAKSGVEQLCIYKLTGLPRGQSQELFCSYAFCQPYPLQGFEDLVDRFLKVCEGLPLALKVFGALLFEKDKSYWEAELYELKVLLRVSPEIKNRLKISYDALSEEEQQIFLDIACFFIGEKKSSAITVWDESRWNGLLGFTNLEGKCLVEVDDKNVIHMHDHLRDLGREVAEDKLPRRLWRPTGNIDDWLHKQSSVITEARGIRMLPEGQTSSQMLSWYQRRIHRLLGNFLKFMPFSVMNLQLLETKGHLLERILRVHSPNLIWLSWRDCPYTYLPSWMPIKNLRVLKVEGGELKTLWQGKSQAPLQLRGLEITKASRLLSIPKSIGQLKHLERISIVSSFHCFGHLHKLPEEFGHLKSLRALVLHVHSMKSLPESFGKLTNLHHMDLSWCRQLERLPDSFGSLTNLHHMDLTGCWQLERLPDSFGSLTNLHHMDLYECWRLERLPDSFCSLTNLYHMDLTRCWDLERLPDSFGSLTNLHHLNLSWCKQLGRLPDSFGSLTNLYYMDLSGCKRLQRLPDSFCNLKNLHHIDLSGCGKLKGLPDSFGSLTNLHHMDLSGCGKLERLPDSFCNLTNLHYMNLSRCGKLERLPDSFGSLTNLHHINLTLCKKLERLPNSFGSCNKIKYLNSSRCSNLTISSDTLGNIRTLEHIDFSGCGKIEVWPLQLAHQRSLKILKLMGTNIKELPSAIEVPTDLEVLWAESPLLDTLHPLLGDLRNLKELRLKDCRELKCLPASVGRLSQLTQLKVAGCPAIELPFKKVREQRETVRTLKSNSSIHKYMPCLQKLTLQDTEISEVSFDEGVCPNLRKFILRECINLVEVGTLPNTLTYVKVSSCYNLRSIEGLSGLAMLQSLFIGKCNELHEMLSVKTLVALESLCAIDCVKLKSIQELAQLTKLRYLDVSGCLELEKLEGVEYCRSLSQVVARRCPKLVEKVVERLRQSITTVLE